MRRGTVHHHFFLSISQARVEQILDDTIRARELIGIRWDRRDTPPAPASRLVDAEIEGRARFDLP